MTYDEARAYLDAHQWMGSIYGIDTMRLLADALNHPELSFPIIHIAGTNGKGSTVAAMSSVLLEAGYHIMSYTSPEVLNYLDRFRLDGQPIDKAIFAKATERVAAAADALAASGKVHPTVFEMELAVSWLIAQDTNIDYFIMETGMGGKMDATNIVSSPILTIITTIGKDHEAFLGHTLEEIANEKAGIIKHGVPLVTWPHPPAVSEVLEKRSKECSSPYIEVAKKDYTVLSVSENRQWFLYKDKKWSFSLLGPHQVMNACGVIESVETLRKLGLNISDDALQKGLDNTLWPARFEKLSDSPEIYIDGAHNPEAVAALMATLDNVASNRRRHFIVHIFRDKAVSEMLSLLEGNATDIYCTSVHHERSLDAEELAALAKAQLPSATIHCIPQIENAVKSALQAAEPKDVIVIFGSLSHLQTARATVYEAMKGHRND